MSSLYEQLEQIKCTKFLNGPTLEDHLKAIFAKLCLENQENALKLFENYSYQLKMLGFDPEESEANKMKEPFSHISENFKNAPLILNVKKIKILFLYRKLMLGLKRSQ